MTANRRHVLQALGTAGLGSAAAGTETGVNVSRITEAARASTEVMPRYPTEQYL
jgi:hypothetical protein